MLVEIDEELERSVGHGVRWRKGVLGLLMLVACMNSAWGIVEFAQDVRRLLNFGPDLYMTLLSLGFAVVSAQGLNYSERLESGEWKTDAVVLALFAVICRLLLRFDAEDLGLVWLVCGALVYISFIFLYPFAHRLDTGKWRSDMLFVLGFFAALAGMIYLVWIR